MSVNVSDSVLFNAFYDEGCKYNDTGQNDESEKNWAQQIEEGYDLQLTLALRLTAEASLAEDPHFRVRESIQVSSVLYIKSFKSNTRDQQLSINAGLKYSYKCQVVEFKQRMSNHFQISRHTVSSGQWVSSILQVLKTANAQVAECSTDLKEDSLNLFYF